MSKTPNFLDDLEFGEKWEEAISDYLEDHLRLVMVSNISFEEDPETQLDGIDSILQQDDATFDVKTERGNYRNSPNIPLEIWSQLEYGKLGWLHTSQSDYLIWVRPDETETNIHSTHLIVLSDELRDWFFENRKSFERKKVPNPGWTTVIRLVPMEEFPDGTIYEFDLALSEPIEDLQQQLDDWVEVNAND